MAYVLFYSLIIIAWFFLAVSAHFRTLDFRHAVIWIASIAYSLVYEIILGIHFGLYYYMVPPLSALYMAIGGVFLYSVFNVLYILYLPRKTKAVYLYTMSWVGGMLLLEYASLRAGTIVFTGWRLFPWSILTYLATYAWLIAFFRYMSRREGLFVPVPSGRQDTE